jgi:hypothetical protein
MDSSKITMEFMPEIDRIVGNFEARMNRLALRAHATPRWQAMLARRFVNVVFATAELWLAVERYRHITNACHSNDIRKWSDSVICGGESVRQCTGAFEMAARDYERALTVLRMSGMRRQNSLGSNEKSSP